MTAQKEQHFWAIDSCEAIPEILLRTKALKDYAVDALQHFEELAILANSLRSIQRRDGSFINGALAESLLTESASALEKAAKNIGDCEVADRLRLRANCLRRGDTEQAALELAKSDRDKLVVLCGPLVTWPGKSSAYLYSALVALEDEAMTARVKRLDATFPELKQYYEDVLELSNLRLVIIPLFTVTDLALCGGEANGFPKHFSYFLPEDEGYKGARYRKTLVFRNVYLERLRHISIPLLEEVYGYISDEKKERILDPELVLRWFRGHDLGHSWRHDSAMFKPLRERVGKYHSFALQEALSDVLGYLALLGPWQPANSPDEESAMLFYLSEMLRFVSRKGGMHPDLEASYLVLSYLYRGGFIQIDPITCQICVEADSFNAGIQQAARRLAHGVLGGQVDDAHALLEEFNFFNDMRKDALGLLITRLQGLYSDVRYRNDI